MKSQSKKGFPLPENMALTSVMGVSRDKQFQSYVSLTNPKPNLVFLIKTPGKECATTRLV